MPLAKKKVLVLAVALSVFALTACSTGPTTGPSSSAGDNTPVGLDKVTDAQAQAQVDLAQPGSKLADLPPEMQEALRISAIPVDKKLEDKFWECIEKKVCETGHGDLTVGIAESASSAVPYRTVQDAEMVMQALRYPRTKKIIWNEAGGDLQQFLANFRSLVDQGANIISGQFDFGSSMLPVVKYATSKGALVVPFSQEVVGAKPGTDVLNIFIDTCTYGKNMVSKAADVSGASSGTIVLATGIPGNTFGSGWIPCAQEQAKSIGWKSVLVTTNWTPQGEQQAASALIASGDKTDAIVYDYNAQAFLTTYLDAGVRPPVVVGAASGAGFVRAAQTAAQKFPGYEAIIGYSQLPSPRVGITAAMDKIDGKKVPGTVVIPHPFYTIDQIADQITPEMPDTASANSLFPPEWQTRILTQSK